MPALPFVDNSYDRIGYGVPQALIRNMYVEETPGGPGPSARISRPGLVQSYTVGVGPIRAIYRGSGVVGGSKYTVSGAALYRDNDIVGGVGSDGGLAFIAGSDTQLGIVSAGLLYCYDGSTLTEQFYFKDSTDPLPEFSGIEYISGRFYLTVTGSDQYFWAELSDLTEIDGLSFATAESSPDVTTAIKRLGDEVWFFGEETVEPWYQTGDPDTPLQRSQGRKFEKGTLSSGSVLPLDNTLFFLGADRIVYRSGQVPKRISTHGIEFFIQSCSSLSQCTAFTCAISGHLFYVLTISGVTTFAYDVAKDQWSEWTSFGRETFLGKVGTVIDGITYVGSSVDGKVYTLDASVSTDDGQLIECMASATVPIAGRNIVNFSLMLQANRGLGTPTGTYTDPQVEVSYSDDACRTWSTWKRASLGAMGSYAYKAIWRRLGLMTSPGRTFRFRVTDPVRMVFEFVTFNESTP